MDNRDWNCVFTTALQRECFSQTEIQQIYKTEMEARTFFDFGGIVPDFLAQYYWESRSTEVKCPFCCTVSSRECKDYFSKQYRMFHRTGWRYTMSCGVKNISAKTRIAHLAVLWNGHWKAGASLRKMH